MINRREIKRTAKDLIKPSYWKNVGAGLLLSIACTAGIAATSFRMAHTHVEVNNMDLHTLIATADPGLLLAALGMLLTIVVSVSLASNLILKLLALPMEVGCRSYFIHQCEGASDLKECISGYTGNFGNVFVTMIIRDIKLILWSMLFLVPGIVKHYEYRMVPYILAGNPEMNRHEVFAISKAMMRGHKMDAFLLDFSFIGWGLLGVLTLGLSNLFYAQPYKAAADAEFFEAVCAA